MSDVSQLLSAIDGGDRTAAAELLPLVYDELRKLAASQLANENPGHSLQATALVHEAYLRLVRPNGNQTFDNRGHFFAAAAEAMRRLLIENARRKRCVTHGGDRQRVPLDAVEPPAPAPTDDVLALDEALDRLTSHDPVKADVVKLRYFAGLTMPEVARALDISLATAERHWTYARTWLYAELDRSDPDH